MTSSPRAIKRTYRDMTTPSGLAEIATYATAIGPHKLQVIPLIRRGQARAADVAGARRARGGTEGSCLHVPCREPVSAGGFALEMRIRNAWAICRRELRVYLEAGLDGFFTDHADYGVKARDAYHMSMKIELTAARGAGHRLFD